MSVFVDTGVYYALQNQRANRHEAAKEAFRAVLQGEHGTAFTSEYIYDEAVTLVLVRTGEYEEARTVGDRMLGRGDYPGTVDLLEIDRETFDRADELFDRYSDQLLSFTDASTVALVESYEIDHVLSFDDDFDGIVPRLDPADIGDE
jgi:predicted nucleic acid-binding protein